MLYKGIFRDVQAIGGVAAFVMRAPKRSDYFLFLRAYLVGREEAAEALLIHDAFFGAEGDLDDDEIRGLGYAEYLYKLGQAGADSLWAKLGEEGYGKHTLCRFACVRIFLTCIRLLFPRYKEHFRQLGRKTSRLMRERLGEEAYCAHMRKLNAASHASKAASKKPSATHRARIEEEFFREFQHSNKIKLQFVDINLTCAHPPGMSDATDFKVHKQLSMRLSNWKKKRGASFSIYDPNVEKMRLLMKKYNPGFNRENNRRLQQKKKK